MRQVESAIEVHLIFDFMTEYCSFFVYFLYYLNLYLSRCYNKLVDITVNTYFLSLVNMFLDSRIFANFLILILYLLWHDDPVNSVSVTEGLFNRISSLDSSDEVSDVHF